MVRVNPLVPGMPGTNPYASSAGGFFNAEDGVNYGPPAPPYYGNRPGNPGFGGYYQGGLPTTSGQGGTGFGLPNQGFVPADVLAAFFPYLTYGPNQAMQGAMTAYGTQADLARASMAANASMHASNVDAQSRAAAAATAAQAAIRQQLIQSQATLQGLQASIHADLERARMGDVAAAQRLQANLKLQADVQNQQTGLQLAGMAASNRLADNFAARLSLRGMGDVPKFGSAIGRPINNISAPNVAMPPQYTVPQVDMSLPSGGNFSVPQIGTGGGGNFSVPQMPDFGDLFAGLNSQFGDIFGGFGMNFDEQAAAPQTQQFPPRPTGNVVNPTPTGSSPQFGMGTVDALKYLQGGDPEAANWILRQRAGLLEKGGPIEIGKAGIVGDSSDGRENREVVVSTPFGAIVAPLQGQFQEGSFGAGTAIPQVLQAMRSYAQRLGSAGQGAQARELNTWASTLESAMRNPGGQDIVNQLQEQMLMRYAGSQDSLGTFVRGWANQLRQVLGGGGAAPPPMGVPSELPIPEGPGFGQPKPDVPPVGSVGGGFGGFGGHPGIIPSEVAPPQFSYNQGNRDPRVAANRDLRRQLAQLIRRHEPDVGGYFQYMMGNRNNAFGMRLQELMSQGITPDAYAAQFAPAPEPAPPPSGGVGEPADVTPPAPEPGGNGVSININTPGPSEIGQLPGVMEAQGKKVPLFGAGPAYLSDPTDPLMGDTKIPAPWMAASEYYKMSPMSRDEYDFSLGRFGYTPEQADFERAAATPGFRFQRRNALRF